MDGELLKGMGERISARRKSLGLTQERVAEQLNVSVQMVSNLECGRKAVRLPNLVKLSKVLDISCDYLLTGEITNFEFDELFGKIRMLSEDEYAMIELLVNYCINKKRTSNP